MRLRISLVLLVKRISSKLPLGKYADLDEVLRVKFLFALFVLKLSNGVLKNNP
jgi:hypothetical protein